MEVKIGHILKTEKENIQKTGRSEKEDMQWRNEYCDWLYRRGR